MSLIWQRLNRVFNTLTICTKEEELEPVDEKRDKEKKDGNKVVMSFLSDLI